MNRSIILASAMLGSLVLAAPSQATDVEVTKAQYAHVRPKSHQHAGWTRQRVQRTFGTTGTRQAMWYGEGGRRHLTKTYPGVKGATITIEYTGAQTSSSTDFSGPYRTKIKSWTPAS